MTSAENAGAVVLLSGGLDSATTLALAKAAGNDCHALSFCYGQRHRAEIAAARRVAGQIGVSQHRIFDLDLAAVARSALTDEAAAVPTTAQDGIPPTYVPARNTVFLSLALAWAETLGCNAIYIGVNAVDYSGYPDCRPEFVRAFQRVADLATRAGVEGRGCRIVTPLIALSKAEIIRRGAALGVDYSLTVSCYQADADGLACGQCDSCRLRKQGFHAAGTADPTRYVRPQELTAFARWRL